MKVYAAVPAQGNSATSGHQQAVSKLGLGTEWRRAPVSSFPRKRESRGGGGVLQRRFPAPPRLWIPAFAGMTIWGVCASLGWRFDTACQVLFRLGLVQSISYGNGCEEMGTENAGAKASRSSSPVTKCVRSRQPRDTTGLAASVRTVRMPDPPDTVPAAVDIRSLGALGKRAGPSAHAAGMTAAAGAARVAGAGLIRTSQRGPTLRTVPSARTRYRTRAGRRRWRSRAASHRSTAPATPARTRRG